MLKKTASSTIKKKTTSDTSTSSDSTLSDMTAFSAMTVTHPAASTPAPAPVKVGSEFTANTTTAGGQFFSTVATFANGGYVIAWTDTSYTEKGTNASGAQIRAQIIDANNHKVGKEFQVNTAAQNGQYLPQIAVLTSGNFVITWEDDSSTGGDKSGAAVRGQMYQANGTKVGGEFLVNTTTTGDQEAASVTALADGGFVVAFQSSTGDGNGLSVRAQIYHADGTRNGTEFQLNTQATNDQSLPSITALHGANSGSFIAVWEDDSRLNNDGSREGSIKSQMFDASGHKVGSEMVVNAANITYVNTAPNIVALANGGYAVTWQGQSDNPRLSTDTDDSNIQMQIFDANGHKVGTQLQVNQEGDEYQQAPKLTELTNGFIVVTWEDVKDLNNEPNGDPGQIKGRVIDELGNPVGDEFTINGTATGEQHTPSIAALPNGQFIVTWTDNSGSGTDKDDDSIHAQIFSVDGNGVIPVTPPPPNVFTAANETKSGAEDSPFTIAASALIGDATNPAHVPLTLSLGHATHGTVSMVNGNVQFTPDANFSGVATFDYTLGDGMGTTSTATVTVNVAPVADTPTLSVSSQTSTLPANTVLVGSEFSANGIKVGGEFFSDVATFSDGGYVVAYTDTSYTDGEENAGIRARIFDKNGNGGADIHVNTTVAGGQYLPKIAILSSGNFVIVWNDEGQNPGDTTGDAVRGQMYTRSGTPIGSEFIVNTSTVGDQENASVTALADGGFVVAFQSASGQGDTSGLSVRAQMYHADGTPNGAEFQLNTQTTNDQSLPSITSLQGANSGRFVAVWEDDSRLNNDGSREGSIKAQVFDASGNKVGGETLVNASNITYVNTAPIVVGLANGGYAVTWQGQSDNPGLSTDTDDSNIQFQIIDANGHKVGSQLQVNQVGDEYQQAPRVTELTNGFIVVTWEDVKDLNNEPGADPGQIKGRVIDEQGNPVGAEFTINTDGAGDQHTPAIAALPNGQFIVTWTSDSIAGDDDDGIRAQVFAVGSGGVTQVNSVNINIAANVADKDGSETVDVTVSGVPVGVTLSDGVHTFTADASHTSVDVSNWRFNNLTASGATSNFQLTVTATSTDTATFSDGSVHTSTSQPVMQTVNVVLPAEQQQQPAAMANTMGGTGNDVLFGSSGNDVLTGGGGNDTYQFTRGGGQDQIVNGTMSSTTVSGELDFGASITDNQLWFQRNGNDLTIDVMGSQDKITVAGWFNGAGSQLQEITAGGMKIDAGVSQLVQAMANYSSAHAGFDPTTATQAPADTTLQAAISANWHS